MSIVNRAQIRRTAIALSAVAAAVCSVASY